MISLALAIFALGLFFLSLVLKESRAWRATIAGRTPSAQAAPDSHPLTREEAIAMGDAAMKLFGEEPRLREVEEAPLSEKASNERRPFYPADIMPGWEDQDEREAMDEDGESIKRAAQRQMFNNRR